MQLGAPPDEFEAHKDDHTRLIEEYVALLVNELDGKPPTPSQVAELLDSWLNDHIVNHDLKIRNYLAIDRMNCCRALGQAAS